MRFYILCVLCFLINFAKNVSSAENFLVLNKLNKIKEDINYITSKMAVAKTDKCLTTKEHLQHQSPGTTARIKIRQRNLSELEQKLKQMLNFVETTAIFNVPGGGETNDERDFEILANLIESLSDINVIHFTVRALRDDILDDSDYRTPFKWIRLAKILETRILSQTNVKCSTKQFVQFTIDELKDSISVFTLEALNTTMTRGEFERNGEMDNLTTEIYHFDPLQWENIIVEFVKSNYGQMPSKQILKTILSHRHIQQRATGVSVLFWKLEKDGNLNSGVTIKIASALFKFRSDSEFENLNKTQQDKIDKIIAKLPVCARNLFFLPRVCFWNKGKEKYLTAGAKNSIYDSKTRFVYSSDLSEKSYWFVKKSSDDDGDDTFFISNHFYANEHMYLSFNRDSDNNLRFVFNYTPGRTPKEYQSEWTVILNNDYCYVKSALFNELLFSSDLRKSEQNDSLVFAWPTSDLVSDPKFQWQIRKC